ncbi:DUF1007 family protein [Thermoproteota archaeon]
MLKNIVTYLIIVFLTTGYAYGHPHVFIEGAITAQFNAQGLEGFYINWLFDEMFSSSIYMDYDKNKDKKFNEEEMNLIKEEAFSNLENYNYFTHISTSNEIIKLNKVEQFKVTSKGTKVEYSFFIPCLIQAGDVSKKLSIGMYDESYFVDIAYKEKSPFTCSQADLFKCTFTLKENPNHSFYLGQFNPLEYFLSFKRVPDGERKQGKQEK